MPTMAHTAVLECSYPESTASNIRDEIGTTVARLKEVIDEEASLRSALQVLFIKRREEAIEQVRMANFHLHLVNQEEAAFCADVNCAAMKIKELGGSVTLRANLAPRRPLSFELPSPSPVHVEIDFEEDVHSRMSSPLHVSLSPRPDSMVDALYDTSLPPPTSSSLPCMPQQSPAPSVFGFSEHLSSPGQPVRSLSDGEHALPLGPPFGRFDEAHILIPGSMRTSMPQALPTQFENPQTPPPVSTRSHSSPTSPIGSLWVLEAPISRSPSSHAPLEEEAQSPATLIEAGDLMASPGGSTDVFQRTDRMLPGSRRRSPQQSHSRTGSPGSRQERKIHSIRFTQAQVSVTIAQAKLIAWERRRSQLAKSVEDAQSKLVQCERDQMPY